MGPTSVRLRGPLAPYRDSVWSGLMAQCYSPLTALNLLRVMSHLSRWLAERRMQPRRLSVARIERYLADRREAGYTAWLTFRSLEPVLCQLRQERVVPPMPASKPKRTALAVALADYRAFLDERGLVPSTIGGYLRVAESFLSGRQRGARALRSIAPAEVTAFILREAGTSSVGYAQLKVTGLRSFLRFLHIRGEIDRDLSGALPAVAGTRLRGLPKGLGASEARRLLRSCDRRTRSGLRNFAILVLLLRLGLRALEVTTLTLDDINWRRGEIVIHGKGPREGRMPLPPDVGEALAAYLERGRPSSVSRSVFLRLIAPHGGLGRSAVTGMVRAAGIRSGLGPVSAHQLRHTTAGLMLSDGATLHEIAQVLRHRSTSTTAIYAKVDDKRLSMLARPWPRGGVR